MAMEKWTENFSGDFQIVNIRELHFFMSPFWVKSLWITIPGRFLIHGNPKWMITGGTPKNENLLHMGMGQNPGTVPWTPSHSWVKMDVNNPLKMVSIGIDPYPYEFFWFLGISRHRERHLEASPKFRLQKRGKNTGTMCSDQLHLYGGKSLDLNLELVEPPRVFHEVHVFVAGKLPIFGFAGKTRAIHPLVDYSLWNAYEISIDWCDRHQDTAIESGSMRLVGQADWWFVIVCTCYVSVCSGVLRCIYLDLSWCT